ncbi:MAG: hypothetical protein Q4B58_09080, partial [Bacteroidales bacterium]|nr:hypothetical protein [Bacteroidales bacterium]
MKRERPREGETRHLIYSSLPYGMMKDEETGKVIIFNGSYEAMTFCGQQEFDFDPERLDINYASIIHGCT